MSSSTNESNENKKNSSNIEEDQGDIHSNLWESANNDRVHRQRQQQQQEEEEEQQRSGEHTHELPSLSASSLWHGGDRHGNDYQGRGRPRQHWSDDNFEDETTANNENISSMETLTARGGQRRHGRRRQHDENGNHVGADHDHDNTLTFIRSTVSRCCTLARKLSRPQTMLCIVDWSMMVLGIFYLVLLQQHPKQHLPKIDLLWAFMTAIITVAIFTRLVLSSPVLPCLSERHCSKNVTAHLTLVLFISYGVLGLAAWIIVSQASTTASLPWCPSSSSPNVNGLCQQYLGVVPVVLVVLCVVETMRWIFVQGAIRQYLQDHPTANASSSASHASTAQYPESFGGTPQSHRSRNRPWWWNRQHAVSNIDGGDGGNNGLEEPLIHGQPGWTRSDGGTYMVDDAVSSPRTASRGGGLLGWMTRGGSGSGGPFRSENNNPRDDGSVDYASLSEDWASRSEEDPYWWTRSEN